MMKRFFYSVAVLLALVFTTAGFTACSDDEAEKKEGIPETLVGEWTKTQGADDWTIGITLEESGQGSGYAHFEGEFQEKDTVMQYEWEVADYSYERETGKVTVVAEGYRIRTDDSHETFLDEDMVLYFKNGKLTGIDTYLQKEWKGCTFTKE